MPDLTTRSLSLRIAPLLRIDAVRIERVVPMAITALAFGLLFFAPAVMLVRDWWNLPEAGHGLLLSPVAIYLAWRSGLRPDRTGQRGVGIVMLAGVVLLRYASGLAAEYFTMRLSMMGALVALTVYFFGMRQVLHWWLPFALLFLAIPLPEIVTQALALPLQFKASQMGAAMLEMRHVPVKLSGNIIRIPGGQELFVTEACSGLRSLTAIMSTTILAGAMFLKTPAARVLLLLVAIPIAIVINGVRVFLTGFLVHFVSLSMGTGFMHATEGWLLFLISLGALGAAAAVGMVMERQFLRWRHA